MIYNFTVKNNKKEEISLDSYRGYVLLIVNTATGCGFTPQYQELQQIYDEFKNSKFEILDFPCNQFGEQAPGSDEEIYSFCSGRFGIKFPQFSKIDVNGENAIPLYKWLTANSKFEGFDESPMGMFMTQMLEGMDKDFRNNSSIKWNFTKFLIDRDGNIIKRFEPTVSLDIIKNEIEKLI